MQANFAESPKGEVRSTPLPRFGGPTLGAAIVQARISGVLCRLRHDAPALYIRSRTAQDRDAGKRKADPLVLEGDEGRMA